MPRSLRTPYAFAVSLVGSLRSGKSASFFSTTCWLAPWPSVRLGLRKLGVLFNRVDARHEVGDVVHLDLVAVFRERLALDRAATRERRGEPREHDGFLSFEIRQLGGLAGGRLQFEIGSLVAHLESRRLRHRRGRKAEDETSRQQCTHHQPPGLLEASEYTRVFTGRCDGCERSVRGV